MGLKKRGLEQAHFDIRRVYAKRQNTTELSGYAKIYSVSRNMPERAVAASQQDNLHSRRRFGQDFDHRVETTIIGIDQRVVQDQRHGLTLLEQKVGERDPGEDSELLLGPA